MPRISAAGARLDLLMGHLGVTAAKPVRDRLWKRKRAVFWHRGVRGLEFELQPGQHIDYYIYTSGAFEKRFLYLIDALLPDKRTALDVGANIGNHALFFAGIFDNVHAFEPNPSVIARLKRNIERNRIDNVLVHQFGLSDRNALIPFLVDDPTNLGMGKFISDATEESSELPVFIGDDVIEKLGARNIDFIKLDVEGHEVQALQGLARTIAVNRPYIAFEFHPADFPAGYFTEFQKRLPDYRFYYCVDRPRRSGMLSKSLAYVRNGGLPWIEPLRLPVELSDGKYYQNILAVPRERQSQSKIRLPDF